MRKIMLCAQVLTLLAAPAAAFAATRVYSAPVAATCSAMGSNYKWTVQDGRFYPGETSDNYQMPILCPNILGSTTLTASDVNSVSLFVIDLHPSLDTRVRMCFQ